MRKINQLVCALLLASSSASAGGLLTNTNQNVAFLRNIARNASTDIDAVYSNPAGLAFLNDGFHLSFNVQSAYQTRTITSTFELFKYRGDEGGTRKYKGTASAPFVPSFQAAYKKGDWTLSGSFAITGGGGKCSFDQGLPSFDALVMTQIYFQSGGTVTPNMYTINSSMNGRQYIYGIQLGATYKINDNLSAFAGGRMNYYTGSYEGYLTADLPLSATESKNLANLSLDVDQTGWGLTPILGLDYRIGKLNLGAKYEFQTNLNIENDMHHNTTGMAQFDDGYSTPNDLPAILSLGAQYSIISSVRVMAGYTHYFDQSAGMADVTVVNSAGETVKQGKQNYLSHGTNELTFGAEWDITDRILVSAGYQNTNYGVKDDFQSDLNFSCDSYSLGFGARVKLNKNLAINVAYFFSDYKDYTKVTDNYCGTTLPGKDVFARTNKVFGLGVDYSF